MKDYYPDELACECGHPCIVHAGVGGPCLKCEPPYKCRTFRPKENHAHYAYSGVVLICAYCGWMMDGSTSDHSIEPFRYIVLCRNMTCPNVGIRYLVGDGAKIELHPLSVEVPSET